MHGSKTITCTICGKADTQQLKSRELQAL